MNDIQNPERILAEGRDRLENGDVKGCWKLMGQFSDYAKMAGAVVPEDGVLAHIANERMQRKAETHRQEGRFSEAELQAIRSDIAAGDLGARERNFSKNGHIGVSGQDTVQYHREAFKKHELPEDTYTPAELQKVVGSYWSKAIGADTADVKDKSMWDAWYEIEKRYENDTDGLVRDAADALGVGLGAAGDAAEFFADEVWEEISKEADDAWQSLFGDDRRSDLAPSEPGTGGQSRADRRGEPAPAEPLPSQTATASDAPERVQANTPDSAGDTVEAFRAALDQPIDPGVRPLIKPVEQLTEKEVGEVIGHGSYWPKPDNNLSEPMQRTVRKWYETFFPGGPAATPPETERSPTTPSGTPLADELPLLAIELDRIAPDATETAPAVKRLQTALNGLGRADADDRTLPPLVTDGLLGPKTAARTQQAVARGGAGGVIDAFRRIREDDRMIA